MEKRYYKHKLENLLVIGKIVTLHDLRFERDFVTQTEAHDFWELVYVEKGEVVCVFDGREEALREGEVIFYKPGLIHAHRAEGRYAPNIFVICFECKNEAIRFFEDRRMAVGKNGRRFLVSLLEEGHRTFDLPGFDPGLKKMTLLQTPTLGGQQLIKNYLELFLISLMRDEAEKDSSEAVFLPQEQFDEMISDRVIAYMKEHVTEDLSVSDICSVLHYNKSYIFRQFKKTTGSTMMVYLKQLKVQKAKELLRKTDLAVAEIADALAFESANYFSKIFKKYVGQTPSAYRARTGRKK